MVRFAVGAGPFPYGVEECLGNVGEAAAQDEAGVDLAAGATQREHRLLAVADDQLERYAVDRPDPHAPGERFVHVVGGARFAQERLVDDGAHPQAARQHGRLLGVLRTDHLDVAGDERVDGVPGGELELEVPLAHGTPPLDDLHEIALRASHGPGPVGLDQLGEREFRTMEADAALGQFRAERDRRWRGDVMTASGSPVDQGASRERVQRVRDFRVGDGRRRGHLCERGRGPLDQYPVYGLLAGAEPEILQCQSHPPVRVYRRILAARPGAPDCRVWAVSPDPSKPRRPVDLPCAATVIVSWPSSRRRA